MNTNERRGFYDMHQPMSKTQPAKLSDRKREGQADGNTFGDEHDFNSKSKVTNTNGSDYHDIGRSNAYLHGNFAEKDASIAYLKERGMKGQEIRNYSGLKRESRLHTGNSSGTAYNSNPIAEVYSSATSNKMPCPDPVIRPPEKKPESVSYKENQKDQTAKLK